MQEIYTVFILDNVKSIRSRLQLLFNTKDFNIIEASNPNEFFNIFSHHKYNGNLIIMDIDLREEDGFKVIREIRDKNKNIPIIILTANNHRDTFIKGILQGVTDYILKPFDDLIIKDKINKVLNYYHDENEIESKIIFNLPLFLQSEFIKSKKGKYSTSLMMSTLYKPTRIYSSEIGKEYLKLSTIVYDKLKDIFWETDVFTKYGSQSFIGVFPFASKVDVNIILKKVDECFNNLKENNKHLNEYFLSSVFITYPDDITEAYDVILKLIDKTKENIKLSKELLFKKEEIKEVIEEDIEEE